MAIKNLRICIANTEYNNFLIGKKSYLQFGNLAFEIKLFISIESKFQLIIIIMNIVISTVTFHFFLGNVFIYCMWSFQWFSNIFHYLVFQFEGMSMIFIHVFIYCMWFFQWFSNIFRYPVFQFEGMSMTNLYFL